MRASAPHPSSASARVAVLERELAKERAARVEVTRQRDLLREAHERLRLELELLKRRLFVAKAERVDTAQLELEFAAKLAELDRIVDERTKTDEAASSETSPAPSEGDDDASDASGADGAADPKKPPKRKRPTGPRDLSTLTLEVERIEIADPVFEALVAEGKAERISAEESSKIMRQRAAFRRVVVSRITYRTVNARGDSELETAPVPPQILERSIATPSLLAYIVADKYCDGLPLNRIEERARREGVSIDRGTMCRWIEDVGGTVGATVVAAMKADAIANAFCIATDATGVALQPVCDHGELPTACKTCRTSGTKAPRRACRRGHFFTLVADRDHVLFEFTLKETSAFVSAMLAGFCGYLQADAKSIYDTLFGPDPPDEADELEPAGDDPARTRPLEVGCWAHARRKFWEAACAKDAVAREGLARIGRIFQVDEELRGKPPRDIGRGRALRMRPHMDAFFEWVDEQWALVKDQRGLRRAALGYALRQRAALRRVLDDGRLHLDNNRSERALRPVAVGRKAWLFVGTEDHAESAAALMSLVASARLHKLDPEAYLRDLFRVLPHWPHGRFLELSPRDWPATRARLHADELKAELGPLTVPPPLASEQQAAAG